MGLWHGFCLRLAGPKSPRRTTLPWMQQGKQEFRAHGARREVTVVRASMKPGEDHARSHPRPSSSALERRLLAGFGSTALVLIVAAFSFAELSSVASSKQWVRHTID